MAQIDDCASAAPEEGDISREALACAERERREAALAALAARALEGDEGARGELFASPVALKGWLDQLAGRREGEGGLIPNATPTPWGYASGARSAARFGERGLPQDAEALLAQYGALGHKGARADFKSDVQGIERAILEGSPEALREMLARSPMALWAMDFSLSEYEAENALGFAAKYAPAGPDAEIVAQLRSLGARLPERRLTLEVGAHRRGASGVWVKSARQVADALASAGYEFGYADGLCLLRRAAFERDAPGDLPSVAEQKVAWLDELERRGVDWRQTHGPAELAAMCAQLPEAHGGTELAASMLAHAEKKGAAGLGAWLGLGHGPLRDAASWSALGPWLARHGLAGEALAAAAESGASLTWERLLPYAEAESIEAASLPGRSDAATGPMRL